MQTLDAGWQRPIPDATSLRRDVWLGLGLGAAGVLGVALAASVSPGPALGWRGVEAYVWALAVTLPLCLRRRFPIAVMVASSLAFYAIGSRLPVASTSYGVQIALFMAVFTAWAWARNRTHLQWATAAVFAGMSIWVAWLTGDVFSDPGGGGRTEGPFPPGWSMVVLFLTINVLYFVGALAWGRVSWRAARQRAELAEAMSLLQRQQDQMAARAVQDERVRIARDLHDVVAHHVSGIGVQAAGARRMAETSPATSREALRTIEVSSRRAVQEMQQLVGLLRSDTEADGPDRAPQPGLDQLAGLVEESETNGLTVTYRATGPDLDVPPTTALTIVRTAQEALTNVRKHSTASAAQMVLRTVPASELPGSVEIEVTDDGPSRGRTNEPRGNGWGLTGIRERCAWHHGESEIGVRPGGGFRVRVRIPVGERTGARP